MKNKENMGDNETWKNVISEIIFIMYNRTKEIYARSHVFFVDHLHSTKWVTERFTQLNFNEASKCCMVKIRLMDMIATLERAWACHLSLFHVRRDSRCKIEENVKKRSI